MRFSCTGEEQAGPSRIEDLVRHPAQKVSARALPLDRRVVDAVVEGTRSLTATFITLGQYRSSAVDGGIKLLAPPTSRETGPWSPRRRRTAGETIPGVRPRPGHQPGLVHVRPRHS